ncbi:uncharacterized protein KQ657_000806 [Scheffersomyces spartinae]|uniref:TRP C-terminal domain-containing protein n=1 Tax=Scheffersomyces spartinae TaxID=45513 RepID=A0A9P7V9M3_9ASCO|nr:uncharacterized protein KQ657_000806 [Scheffersomyces spartinae]KAG7193388.1 hypothetical protein KQ657_000806 [Scheffersomyces spartinae]
MLSETAAKEETIAAKNAESQDASRISHLSRSSLLHHSDYAVSSSSNINFASSNSTIEALFDNKNSLRRCPLYHQDSIMFYYEVKIPPKYRRSLGSFKATFSVTSNNELSDTLGCYSVLVTPVRFKQMKRAIEITALTLLVFATAFNGITITFSYAQESANPFLHLASSMCNKELLSHLDATASLAIQYFQYAYFLGCLGLSYPGFYQQLMLQFRGACLVWVPIFGDNAFDDNYHSQDHVYLSFDKGGLNVLKYYSSLGSFRYFWINFIILYCSVCLGIVSFQQIMLFIVKRARMFDARRREITTPNFRLISKNNVYFIVGQVLNIVYNTFAFPLLVVTLFVIYNSASFSGDSYARYNLNGNQKAAFNPYVPYAALRVPWQCYEYGTGIFNAMTSLNKGKVEAYALFPKVNITLGSIVLALWLMGLLWGYLSIKVKFRRWSVRILDSPSKLFTSIKTILLWGFAYYNLKPSKVYFVGIDLIKLFSELIIIGLLQDNGLAQVSCIIVIEVVYFLLILLCRPYCVPMALGTMRLWLPIARILDIFLCIPFITIVNSSEPVKANFAYLQLFLHCFVAVYFMFRLSSSMWIAIKPFLERKFHSKAPGPSKPTLDEYEEEYEFHPVVRSNSIKQKKAPPSVHSKHVLQVPTKLSPINSEDEGEQTEEDNDNVAEDDYYYRQNGANYLKKLLLTSLDSEKQPTNGDEAVGSILTELSTNISVYDLEEEQSRHRLRTNNYSFRESDLIYNTYINDENVDLEIRQLWNTRMCRLSDKELKLHRKNTSVDPSQTHGPKSNPSFEVCRPKPLIVKSTRT